MSRLLLAKGVAEEIRAEVARGAAEVSAKAGRAPGLAAVLVGDDPASRVYVASKTRACEEAGLASFSHLLPAATGEGELNALLDQLNADPRVDGILLQLPLPGHLPTRRILERMSPDKDVDGFHPVNVGRLWNDEAGFVPCTPAGIVESLKRHGIALAGRHAVVVGRSTIVGKPMAGLLLRENCTVTIAHSKTKDLAAVCSGADLLVAAVGRPGMIGAAHVRDGAVVVDVGINRVEDRELGRRLVGDDPKRLASFDEKGYVLVGDVDFPAASAKASAITPVPGGVGPLTVAMLLANTLTSARRRYGIEPMSAGVVKSVRVGLTGGLASGKSTVAGLLARAGFQVVDADRIVAHLYRAGGEGAQAIARTFGPEYLDAEGAVDKPKIAKLVFADDAARKRLEAEVHPLVRSAFRALAGKAQAPMVLEATRLVEAGYAPDFDLIVSIEAPEEQRLQRAMARNLTREEAVARLTAQGDGAKRREVAHRLIWNDGTPAELEEKVARLVAEIRRRHSEK